MKPGELRKAALTGARWTVASRVGLQLVTWPITIVVMRLLEPGDYGLFAIALLFTGFIALFSELGLGVALVQASTVDEPMARAASTLVLLLNGAVALAIVAVAPWVANVYDTPDVSLVMRVLTLELLCGALAAVPQALLERQLQFRSLSLAHVSGGIAGAATTLTAALFDAGVWALVAGTLVMALVRSGLLIVLHGRLVWPGRVRLATVRPMVHVSSQVVAGRVLWYWYGQADQLVLGKMLHAVQLGFYSVAAQLAMLPVGKAMEAVNRVAFPILSRARADSESLREMHLRVIGMVALYGFGVCWGLAAVAQEFVAVVLGAKWQAATTPLAMLSIIAPLRMLCALNNTTTTAVGAPEAATKELVFAAVVIPLAVTAGAWWGGLVGAATAWLVTFPVVYLVSNWLTCAAVGLATLAGSRPLVAPIFSGCMMFAGVWFIRRTLSPDTPVALLLGAEIFTGAAVYAGMMWLVARAVVDEARAFLRDMLRPNRVLP